MEGLMGGFLERLMEGLMMDLMEAIMEGPQHSSLLAFLLQRV
jgi:hypothetical protein